MLNAGLAHSAPENLPPWAAVSPGWQEECELSLDPLLVAISVAAARLQDGKQSRRCLHLPLSHGRRGRGVGWGALDGGPGVPGLPLSSGPREGAPGRALKKGG